MGLPSGNGVWHQRVILILLFVFAALGVQAWTGNASPLTQSPEPEPSPPILLHSPSSRVVEWGTHLGLFAAASGTGLAMPKDLQIDSRGNLIVTIAPAGTWGISPCWRWIMPKTRPSFPFLSGRRRTGVFFAPASNQARMPVRRSKIPARSAAKSNTTAGYSAPANSNFDRLATQSILRAIGNGSQRSTSSIHSWFAAGATDIPIIEVDLEV